MQTGIQGGAPKIAKLAATFDYGMTWYMGYYIQLVVYIPMIS